MIARVRFEDEADAAYQQAGRWYESRREGLGIEMNVRIPSNVAPGPAGPVRLTYSSRPSKDVTIEVR